MIPARAGSKGVEGKNVKPLCGKPLMQYTIEAACQCKDLDEVYLNTESPHYIQVARAIGCRTYRRPELLAHDSTSMREVLIDFAAWVVRHHERRFAVVVLYPTYPMRTATDITAIIREFRADPALPLVGLKMPATHPYLCYKRGNGAYEQVMDFDIDKHYRRQDYPEIWELTHFACVVPWHAVREVNNQLMNKHAQRFMLLTLEKERLINVDTPDDFEYAQFLMERKWELKPQ